jgi:CheY-like chemotaxis protein
VTNILIVEDRRRFEQALARLLGPVLVGPTIFARAASPSEAMRLLSEEGPFDLVVLDLGDSSEAGGEFVREIKALSPRTRVAVLGVADATANRVLAAWSDEIKPESAGLDEVLSSLADVVGAPLRPGHLNA